MRSNECKVLVYITMNKKKQHMNKKKQQRKLHTYANLTAATASLASTGKRTLDGRL